MLTTHNITPQDRQADQYDELLAAMYYQAQGFTGPLFTTNCPGLMDMFLSMLPEEARQHYTCNSCRRFLDNFGPLVTIDPETGETRAAVLPRNTPPFFAPIFTTLIRMVESAKVTGVFITSKNILGEPITGEWRHLSFMIPYPVHKSPIQSADQLMAEKKEDFKLMISALKEYPASIVKKALTLLRSEALYRSEKVMGPAEWYESLLEKRAAVKNKTRQTNLLWYAVATAPAGFCHLKNTMIGTLLDDLASGMSYKQVGARFAEKMKPTQYQRPQVAPKAGNIAQAEKIVEALQSSGALRRRFARLDEITTLWKPTQPPAPQTGNGVFGHLTPKGQAPGNLMEIGLKDITWKKFEETILPQALKIEFFVPYGNANYGVITTASEAEAPPILQWDREEARNPLAWFVLNGGAPGRVFNLKEGEYCEVTGVCRQPSEWSKGGENHGHSIFLILRDCKYKEPTKSGNALFPECLKSEYHGIRATIEAYSRNAQLEGYDQASACGFRIQSNRTGMPRIRVYTPTARMDFRIDRWD